MKPANSPMSERIYSHWCGTELNAGDVLRSEFGLEDEEGGEDWRMAMDESEPSIGPIPTCATCRQAIQENHAALPREQEAADLLQRRGCLSVCMTIAATVAVMIVTAMIAKWRSLDK